MTLVDVSRKRHATASDEASNSSSRANAGAETAAQIPEHSPQESSRATPAPATPASTVRSAASLPSPSDAHGSKFPAATATAPHPEDGRVRSPEPEPEEDNSRLWTNVVQESGTILLAKIVKLEATHDAVQATMLDPSSARQAMLDAKDVYYHAWVGTQQTLNDESLKDDELDMHTIRAAENYIVNLGKAMLDLHAGPHFTFVDPRRDTTKQIITQAVRMMQKFETAHSRDRVLFSIPATERGVLAARVLERDHNIRTNLTFVSSFEHAVVCIEAGASAITFCCTPMLKAYERIHPMTLERCRAPDHPCIQEIQTTIAYVHMHNCDTQIIASDLCGIGNVEPLEGVDFIAVGPNDGELRWPIDKESYREHMDFFHAPEGSAPVERARKEDFPPRMKGLAEDFRKGLTEDGSKMFYRTLNEGLLKMNRESAQLARSMRIIVHNNLKRKRPLEELVEQYADYPPIIYTPDMLDQKSKQIPQDPMGVRLHQMLKKKLHKDTNSDTDTESEYSDVCGE